MTFEGVPRRERPSFNHWVDDTEWVPEGDFAWLDWPDPKVLDRGLIACVARFVRRGRVSRRPVARRSLKRRQDRRRRELEHLQILGGTVDPGDLPGTRCGSYPPVRISQWRKTADDPQGGNAGPFLDIPEGYVEWLEPEELEWLRGQMFRPSRATVLRENHYQLSARSVAYAGVLVGLFAGLGTTLAELIA